MIAATNKNLERAMEEGRFRKDLWYRLSVFPISVLPLRDRVEDIPLFLGFFVDKYATKLGKTFEKISKKTLIALENYHWPGNIRELENLVERAVITSVGGNLRLEVPGYRETGTSPEGTLADFEKIFIMSALEDANWVIEGPKGAAKRLGSTRAHYDIA